MDNIFWHINCNFVNYCNGKNSNNFLQQYDYVINHSVTNIVGKNDYLIQAKQLLIFSLTDFF